ncbi:MAG: polyhydroxyalkanoate synthesis repressor PhaR [Rhodospirillaceae bacterium TMED167]|nr:polyhydroxyalkanoate synthesis repressor PhaR [Rhodospirillaceae bacterium]OUW26801.1 MAG: polyhydroxyalkanoate synthesis repressor PhaR [Rhodospirillaceae bacterium TMED167]
MAKKTRTAAEAPGAEKPIIIKKYANRRLYNTATGEFVTLETLHQMVQQEELFIVQDAKTGKDLTSSVLTQIIAEEEVKGHNMLPLKTLRQLLKLYSDGIGPQFSSYLEHSIEAFSQNQQKVMQQMSDMLSGNQGIDQWAEMSRRNLELFQNSLSMFNPLTSGGNSTDPSQAPSPQAGLQNEPKTEIETLRQQMAEMQRQLNALSRE